MAGGVVTAGPLAVGMAGAALLAGGGWLWWLRRRLVVVTVQGISMEPALGGGDRMMTHRTGLAALRVGQIVVLEQPVRRDTWQWPPAQGGITDRRWIIKRLVALPGDPVPPEVAARVGATPGGRVPENSLVVLGDNTEASIDSREIGYVPADRVLGVALRRIGDRPT